MLLPTLILVPFFVGIISWQSDRINVCMPRWIALFGSSMVFVVGFFLWLWRMGYCNNLVLDNLLKLNKSSVWDLEYMCTWIPRFGINFHLALDGLSVLMLMLTGILGVMAVLSSWENSVTDHHKGLFYCNLLWILGSVIGVILAVDMFLFFFFWEIVLIPIYFLISIWGYEELNKKLRIIAATKFCLYAQLSGLCMLISIIILVYFNYRLYGIWSFDYENLLHVTLPKNIEYFLMLGFFCAFAIKMPIVPFHTWSLEAYAYSPITGSVDLIGFLVKISIYGFFRFVLPLCPNASKEFVPIAMFLGILNIFYGAWMAFAQTDFKRLIAYSNISHMGFALIAIYSNDQLSYQGVLVQMISCSLTLSGMCILCGQLYKRLYTRNITVMGGLWGRMNLMPAFFLCFIVSMLSIPGTGNFIGEVTILLGSFHTVPIITIIASFGILFASIYSLVLMQRIYYGKSQISCEILLDMTFLEKFIIIVLLLCVLIVGCFPQFIFDTSRETIRNIYCRLQ
ncbi:NADH dehydrogenase I chain M [Candidatus Blochmanniella floridana]|uniref:NADH-quinone oxidoreductase subunit M n=1 Tax=Blochmanniella floridana TaxID=203907 RepID=Q7VRW3_BLOFL|nr:NADH dehydrogenase I chain M [Candidatus Blochmannia floridanus]